MAPGRPDAALPLTGVAVEQRDVPHLTQPVSMPADTVPPASKRRRGRRILRVFAIVLGVPALIAMCGATGYVSAHHHVHIGVYPAPASTYHSTVTTPLGPPVRDHSGNLSRFLLKLPSGARQWFTPRATHGVMTLKQYASFYDDPKDAVSFLKADGFDTAATVNWRDVAGNEVEIRMVRFDDANWAFGIFSDVITNGPSDKELKGSQRKAAWKIPFADGAVYTNGKKDRYGYQLSEGVAIQRDVIIYMWIYQKVPQSMMLTKALLYQQWSKL